MSTTASPLKLRLFLEGVEVPVISADVQATLDGPGASASVQLIATPEVGRLKPRTLVHLFFLDVSTDGVYRLLFCGEVVGISIGKTESSRNASLDCRDTRNYFDSAYTYFMTQSNIRGDAGGSQALLGLLQSQAAFTGATTGFTQLTNNTAELFITQILKDPQPSSWGFQDARGLLGGLLNLIEVFTGLNERDKPGVNQFFTFAEARLKLLGQIGIYEKDETAKRLFQAEAMVNFIAQRLESLGELVPLSKIIGLVLQFMYYRISPNPCALYRPTTRKVRETVAPYAEAATSLRQELQALQEAARTPLEQSASRTFLLGQLDALLPPAEARGAYSDALDQGDVAGASRVGQAQNNVLSRLLDTASTAPADQRTLVVNVAQIIFTLVSLPPQTSVLLGQLSVASGYLLTLSNFVSVAEVDESSRLFTTLVMPDLFFSVAPTCNVVYPDMYYSANYSRDMLQEVTRLHLATDIGAIATGSIVGNEIYYAPSVEALTNLQSKALQLGAKIPEQEEIGRLFDHELNTGIVPSFTTMSRMSQEMAQSLTDPALKTDFFTRIANMQFLQQRLSARNMSVSGVFNPYAAVGFPMVIIDKGVGATGTTRATVGRSDIRKLEQYVGLCTSVSHSVSQTGGSTSYQMQYVRTHRSEDDTYIQQLAFKSEVEPQLQDVIVDGPTLLSEIRQIVDQQEGGREAGVVAEFRFLIDSTVGIVGQNGVDYVGELAPTIALDRVGLAAPRRRVSTFGGDAAPVVSAQVMDVSPVGGSALGAGIPNAVSIPDTSDALKLKIVGAIWEGLSNAQWASAAVLLTGTDRNVDAPYALLRRVISAAVDSGYTDKQRLSDGELLCLMYMYASTRQPARFPLPAYSQMRVGINVPTGQPVKPPIEEAMRPLYLDPAYASPNIGTQVYTPLLGVGSIVDVVESEIVRFGASKMRTVIGVVEGNLIRAEQAEVLSQEEAIDILTLRYSAEASSEYWVKAVRRPIASLEDILGEGGFHDIAHATAAETTGVKRIPLLGAAYRSPDGEAIPPGMRELSREQLEQLEASVDTRIDTRAERKEAVLNYAQSLQSRGLLG